MLLDALQKAPPRSVDDLAIFFERSRDRLIESLDKGRVTGDERQRYLDQFQSGLNEAQVEFLNDALARGFDAHPANQPPLPPSEVLQFGIKQPVMWGVLALVLLVGVAVGALLIG